MKVIAISASVGTDKNNTHDSINGASAKLQICYLLSRCVMTPPKSGASCDPKSTTALPYSSPSHASSSSSSSSSSSLSVKLLLLWYDSCACSNSANFRVNACASKSQSRLTERQVYDLQNWKRKTSHVNFCSPHIKKKLFHVWMSAFRHILHAHTSGRSRKMVRGRC